MAYDEGLATRVRDALGGQPGLAEPGARPSDMGGRPMKGWLLVGPDGYAEDGGLRRWVGRGVSYASSLPPK